MLTGNAAAERNDIEGSGGGDCFTVEHSPDGEVDCCSRDGANALKAKIEAYWRERGESVQVMLHNVGFHPAIRAARFDVRSDMVNGKPRTAGATAKRPPLATHGYTDNVDASDDDLSAE